MSSREWKGLRELTAWASRNPKMILGILWGSFLEANGFPVVRGPR